jgi:oligopeptidase B
MAPLAGLREELYEEMLSHIKQTDVSVPFRDGDVVVLHAHRGGPAVRHSLPQVRGLGARRATRRSRCSWTAMNWPGDTHFSPLAPRRSRTMGAGWPTPPTRRAFASTRCTSRTWTRARRWAGMVERVGSVVWAADGPHPVLHRGGRGAEAPIPALAAYAGHTARRGRAGLSGRRRALQPGRRAHPRRRVPGAGIGQPHDDRVRVLAAEDPLGTFTLISPREDEHEYSVDHRNGCGSSAPTTAGATSAW